MCVYIYVGVWEWERERGKWETVSDGRKKVLRGAGESIKKKIDQHKEEIKRAHDILGSLGFALDAEPVVVDDDA